MVRKTGRRFAFLTVPICAALLLSGCSESGQIVRGGGRVITDVGDDIARWVGGAFKSTPAIESPAAYQTLLLDRLAQVKATPEWMQLRNSIQKGVHLTRESSICGLSIDAITDWDKLKAQGLFETLSEELKGQNDLLALRQTTDDVVSTFREADSSDPLGTTWRFSVLTFKSLYCA